MLSAMCLYPLSLIIHVNMTHFQIHQPLKHTTGAFSFHVSIPQHMAFIIALYWRISKDRQHRQRAWGIVKALPFDQIFMPSIKKPDSVTICVWAQVTHSILWTRVTSRSVCFLRPPRIPSSLTGALYNLDLWKCLLIESCFHRMTDSDDEAYSAQLLVVGLPEKITLQDSTSNLIGKVHGGC